MYLTDKTAYTHGRTVLRLPVVHYELNPMLSWTSVKGYVAKHNKIHTLLDSEQITPDRFTYITTDIWRNYCRHVLKMITLKRQTCCWHNRRIHN